MLNRPGLEVQRLPHQADSLCSEVRPVLLQFRVVHVDSEELWEVKIGSFTLLNINTLTKKYRILPPWDYLAIIAKYTKLHDQKWAKTSGLHKCCFHLVLVIWPQLIPWLWVVLAIPSVDRFQSVLHMFDKVLNEKVTHEQSGFFRARRPRYSIDMVAPPPMKIKRGINFKERKNYKWITKKWLNCSKYSWTTNNLAIMPPIDVNPVIIILDLKYNLM